MASWTRSSLRVRREFVIISSSCHCSSCFLLLRVIWHTIARTDADIAPEAADAVPPPGDGASEDSSAQNSLRPLTSFSTRSDSPTPDCS